MLVVMSPLNTVVQSLASPGKKEDVKNTEVTGGALTAARGGDVLKDASQDIKPNAMRLP